jgi:hypothetical protein
MRCSAFIVISAGAILAAFMYPSSSFARNHSARVSPPLIQDRYCLQGRIWGWPGNCLFSTYSQCMATASGTNAYCDLNPVYAFREWKGYR